MSTSGFVLGDTVEGSENSYLEWDLVSQSTSGNYSTIAWRAGWRFDNYSCRGLRKGTAVVNGVTVYDDDDPGDGVHAFNAGHNHNTGDNKLQTASGTRQINHASDGTKTFTASVGMTGYNGQRSTGSDSWDLPDIPREPSAPTKPIISEVKQTSLRLNWTMPSGGVPATSFTISYGTGITATGTTTTSSTFSKVITGLSPGARYYFKVRATNSAGTGPYSLVANSFTVAGADYNDNGVWRSAIPYVKDGGVWKVARPWGKIAGVWRETI